MSEFAALDRESLVKIASAFWPSWTAAYRREAVDAVRDVLAGQPCDRIVSPAEAERIREMARAARARSPASRRVVTVNVNGGNAP